MSNIPKVSVIIPVYNAEKHLEKCVQSILVQTFKDFEIILVNDGSKDSSGELCDTLAKSDSRIKVIHQENQGVASARNAGINAATSKYIAFCDDDDRYEASFLENMLTVSEYGVMPISKFVKVTQNTAVAAPDLAPNGKAWCWPILNNYDICCTNCIFLRDIVVKKNLKFTDGRKTGEDQEFTLKYMLHINEIQYVEDAIYYYSINPDSTMFQKNYNHFHAVDAMLDVVDYARKVCSDEQAQLISDALNGYKIPRILEFAITTLLTAGEPVKVLLNYLKENGYYDLLQNTARQEEHWDGGFMKLWNISPILCLRLYSIRKKIGNFLRKIGLRK